MSLLKVIVFTVGDGYYALPSANVKEIIDNDEGVLHIVYGGDTLKGVIMHEGELASVLDTPEILGIRDVKKTPFILVCRESRESSAVGLTISAVKGIEFVDTGQIKAAGTGEASYISGFMRESSDRMNKVAAILEIHKFLETSDERIERISALSA